MAQVHEGRPEMITSLYTARGVDVFVSRDFSGVEIVVKALHTLPDGTENGVEELKRAVREVQQLTHDNVVRHFSAFRGWSSAPGQIDRFYITMEYCRGGSLSAAVNGRPLEADLIVKWMSDILSGLAYLHLNQVVHRDLKGANIVLTCQDRAISRLKICDLGDIKKLMGSVTRKNEVSDGHGTYAYMSPEIIDPESQFTIGRKTDIWSFACIVVEMISGERPRFVDQSGKAFRSDSPKILMHVVAGGRPVIPNRCPEWLVPLLDQCLQRDPRERPTASELLLRVSNLFTRDPLIS